MKDDFFILLQKLAQNNVEFVLIGGFAGITHGCNYVTQDIDICLDFDKQNLLKMQKALADINPVHRMTPNKLKLQLTEENCQQYKNLYLDTDLGQLDCISFVKGVGNYQQAKDKSISIETDSLKIQVLDIDALIEAKKTMNRQKDKQAVIELETIKKLKGS
ncbi:MAG: hypothetical protein JW806_01395 [Sedimentisphaerales bacterium]|nr:hypothetical protein [Sedimentisphaerales bacterium]